MLFGRFVDIISASPIALSFMTPSLSSLDLNSDFGTVRIFFSYLGSRGMFWLKVNVIDGPDSGLKAN